MQFRGPGGVGVFAGQSGLPVKWSRGGHPLEGAAAGRGLSQPVIAGGKVFLTACTGTTGERLHVLCLDLATGKQLWERRLKATGLTACHPKTSMAAPTPATDGRRVFALFATGDLVCLDTDGNLEWVRSLVRDYPLVSNQVGMAASPALYKDTLIVSIETDGESFAAGLDVATGENRWKVDRNRAINWTTPILLARGDKTELLLQSRTDLTAYDPQSGAKLWTYPGKGINRITSPTAGDGVVFVPGPELLAIRPGAAGTAPEVAWTSSKLRPGTASPLAHQGKLYTVTGGGILACGSAADGSVLWQERLKGPFSSSPMFADGKLYLVNEEGTTTVIAPDSAQRVLSVNPLGEPILACPVAADGAIFLRPTSTCSASGRRSDRAFRERFCEASRTGSDVELRFGCVGVRFLPDRQARGAGYSRNQTSSSTPSSSAKRRLRGG